MSANTPEELQRIYAARFDQDLEYRRKVWAVLVSDWFGRYIDSGDAVLDLGCGYGELINAVTCRQRYAMDLNPDAGQHVDPGVVLLAEDCSAPWSLPDASLDVVVTSNFLEHLPDKAAVGRTLDEARRCLRPGGRLVALGPNVKHVPGAYWDFWDHHVALTEASLKEALLARDFDVPVCLGRFLPYTMADGPRYPVVLLRAYLRLPVAWRLLGKQFLLVATAR